MGTLMDKVKKLHAAGMSIPGAIKEVLGISVSEFASKHDLSQPTVSQVINGSLRPSEKHLAALIAELGGTEAEWRELLWLAGKPESAAST